MKLSLEFVSLEERGTTMVCFNCKEQLPPNVTECPFCHAKITASQKASKKILILIGVIVMLLIGIVSVTILIFQQLSMDTMDYLEKENYSAAVEQFNKQAEPLDEETRQAFQDAVETLKNLYITGEIDYNQTKQSLDLLKEVHDSSLQAFITAAEEEVAAVKSGREHYEDGETISKENEHAVSSLQNGETSNVVDQTIQDFEQALDDFSSVSEKDVAYYEKATASFQKTLEQYQTYLLAASDSYQKQEDYESAYALLNNVPQMNYLCEDTDFVQTCSDRKTSVLEEWVDALATKHLYFSDGGALPIARSYGLETLDSSYDLSSKIQEGIQWEKKHLLSLINDERQKRGMSLLIWNDSLESLAIRSLDAVDLSACVNAAAARKEENTDGLLVNHLAEHAAEEKLREIAGDSQAYFNDSAGYYSAEQFFQDSAELPEILFRDDVQEIGLALIYDYDVNLIQWLVLTEA
ncbi:MAG: hypothetical protein U0J29_05310 [Ruminococcus sp.]|nr:hypothetical protein [Ruminococcus sp.]